jgi:hypothetical protein
MTIDIAKARARIGSRYPEPFDEPCQNKTRRRLGHAAGLTQFGVNLLELGAGAWSSQRHWHAHEDEFIFVLRDRLCSSPAPARPSSTLAIAPASKPVSVMAINCRTAARQPH